MLKMATVAITSSLATAMLLGLAFASPRQEANSPRRNVSVKLEWVRSNPKTSESLVIVVDGGEQGSVTRPMADGRGNRQVTVTPTVNENGTITLILHVLSTTNPGEKLDTIVTVTSGETKVISAATSKGESKLAKSPSEELIFVTPSRD